MAWYSIRFASLSFLIFSDFSFRVGSFGVGKRGGGAFKWIGVGRRTDGFLFFDALGVFIISSGWSFCDFFFFRGTFFAFRVELCFRVFTSFLDFRDLEGSSLVELSLSDILGLGFAFDGFRDRPVCFFWVVAESLPSSFEGIFAFRLFLLETGEPEGTSVLTFDGLRDRPRCFFWVLVCSLSPSFGAMLAFRLPFLETGEPEGTSLFTFDGFRARPRCFWVVAFSLSSSLEGILTFDAFRPRCFLDDAFSCFIMSLSSIIEPLFDELLRFCVLIDPSDFRCSRFFPGIFTSAVDLDRLAIPFGTDVDLRFRLFNLTMGSSA